MDIRKVQSATLQIALREVEIRDGLFPAEPQALCRELETECIQLVLPPLQCSLVPVNDGGEGNNEGLKAAKETFTKEEH